MTKNEQNCVVAWRLKLLRQASDLPRVLLRPVDTSAFLARLSISGKLGTRVTVRPACATGPVPLSIRRGPRLARLSPRSCICENVISLGQVSMTTFLDGDSVSGDQVS
jgi:hypothetical protein